MSLFHIAMGSIHNSNRAVQTLLKVPGDLMFSAMVGLGIVTETSKLESENKFGS